ncbi:MAG: VOC family protein [bacterium]
MINTHLDHIVVGASSLESGASYVEQLLGVQVPDGGEHAMMGTHNKVMTLGEGVYLEIIAVNPEMTPPKQPRWFGLDDPSVISSLKNEPRLLTWAVNTSDLAELERRSKIAVGKIQQAERGDLRWKVALPDDGRLSAAGFFPLCIEWQMSFHPSEKMPDMKCRLERIEMHHRRAPWLQQCLQSIGADTLVSIENCADSAPSVLTATISTPSGERILSSAIG